MIKTSIFDYSDEKRSAISRSIRQKVFVEEQGVAPELEYDGNDVYATHYLLYYYGVPIGTARSRKTVNGIKLERFAILKEWRAKGLGKHLLEEVMGSLAHQDATIYLHAQQKAVNYYKRYGFQIGGDAFTEAGILHYKMIWKPNAKHE